jgi:hypothetical protein
MFHNIMMLLAVTHLMSLHLEFDVYFFSSTCYYQLPLLITFYSDAFFSSLLVDLINCEQY